MELRWETLQLVLGYAITTLETEVDGADLDDATARERIDFCEEIAASLKVSGEDKPWRDMIGQFEYFVQNQTCDKCDLVWSHKELSDMRSYNAGGSPASSASSLTCPECGGQCRTVSC